MARFGVTEAQLREQLVDENFRKLVEFEVDRTEGLFALGDALLPSLDPSVRPHISLFGRGGRAILQAIRASRYDTLTKRPSLSACQKGKLMLAAITAQLNEWRGGRSAKLATANGSPQPDASATQTPVTGKGA